MRFHILCAATFLAVSSGANGQSSFSMEPIRDNPLRLRLRVIGGTPALAKDWPATLRFQTLIANRLINCTSTVVGDRALVTAAHCIDQDGARGSALLNGSAINVTCSQHPKFKGASVCLQAKTPEELSGCAPDVALCKSDKAMPAMIGQHESVNISEAPIVPKAKIVLLGYGCTAANGSISTLLQVGKADISYVGKIGAANPLAEYTMVGGGSVICSGDSGGAAFNEADPAARKVIGIAARGNLSTTSYLVNTSDPMIVEFMQEWRSAAQVEICGIDSGADHCRHSP
jgi:trypsin